LAFWGPLDPKNWPNRLGFDLPRGQNSLSQREICLGTTDFGLFEVKIRVRVSDLGFQTLELASQRSNLASQRSKMTSERPKIGLPDLKN